MVEYTWDDIIINPNSEEAKACIGKNVYYGDLASICLERANSNILYYKLDSIQRYAPHPFHIELGHNYGCIIRKKEKEYKEEHKEYIPFKDIDEFIAEYEKHTQKLKLYGIWIKRKLVNQTYPIELITGIYLDGVYINQDEYLTSWSEFLEYFVFEDGTPCGKLKE